MLFGQTKNTHSLQSKISQNKSSKFREMEKLATFLTLTGSGMDHIRPSQKCHHLPGLVASSPGPKKPTPERQPARPARAFRYRNPPTPPSRSRALTRPSRPPPPRPPSRANGPPRHPPPPPKRAPSSPAPPAKRVPSPPGSDAAYDADTDEDEPEAPIPTGEPRRPDTGAREIPELPDFLSGRTFLLYGDVMSAETRRQAARAITAFGGKLEQYFGDSIKYVITEDAWDVNFDDAAADHPELMFVRPAWLEACAKKGKLVSVQPYLVTAVEIIRL